MPKKRGVEKIIWVEMADQNQLQFIPFKIDVRDRILVNVEPIGDNLAFHLKAPLHTCPYFLYTI